MTSEQDGAVGGTRDAGSPDDARLVGPAPAVRGEPGIPRREYDERFYATNYPLSSWGDDNAHIKKHLHDVSMPYVDQMFPDYRSQLLGGLDAIGLRKPDTPAKPGRDMTDFIRSLAMDDLDLTLIGFARYHAKYTFEQCVDDVHVKRNVVTVGLEQPYEETQTIPSREAEIATVETYQELATKAITIAETLIAEGYRAQPTIKTMLVQPYFVEAGLGQMGANGQLLSPHCGSRVRLMLILTNAPVQYGQAVDYGIPKLCDMCQVCVNRCPGRALTSEEIWWRGVKKFKTVSSRCVPMLAKYDNCGVCMKVCPVQRYGYQEVMDHLEATGEVLGKGSDELEGYDLPDRGHFGPDTMPTFSREEMTEPGR